MSSPHASAGSKSVHAKGNGKRGWSGKGKGDGGGRGSSSRHKSKGYYIKSARGGRGDGGQMGQMKLHQAGSGLLLTCEGKEHMAVTECYRLLDYYLERFGFIGALKQLQRDEASRETQGAPLPDTGTDARTGIEHTCKHDAPREGDEKETANTQSQSQQVISSVEDAISISTDAEKSSDTMLKSKSDELPDSEPESESESSDSDSENSIDDPSETSEHVEDRNTSAPLSKLARLDTAAQPTLDISAALSAEIAELQSLDRGRPNTRQTEGSSGFPGGEKGAFTKREKKEPLFKQVRTRVKNVLFIRFAERLVSRPISLDPSLFVWRVMHEFTSSSSSNASSSTSSNPSAQVDQSVQSSPFSMRTRFVRRVMPVQTTCHASIDAITAALKTLLSNIPPQLLTIIQSNSAYSANPPNLPNPNCTTSTLSCPILENKDDKLCVQTVQLVGDIENKVSVPESTLVPIKPPEVNVKTPESHPEEAEAIKSVPLQTPVPVECEPNKNSSETPNQSHEPTLSSPALASLATAPPSIPPAFIPTASTTATSTTPTSTSTSTTSTTTTSTASTTPDTATFTVVYECRNHGGLCRDDLLRAVSATVRSVCPGWRVDAHSHAQSRALTARPCVGVLVQVLAGSACVALAPEYHSLRKYNLAQLQKAAT